jgi:hypothetical protein
MFHELMSRDRKGGRATGQPQGVGSEAYLNGTSQGPTPEDGQIRGRSKQFMKYPGLPYQTDPHKAQEMTQLIQKVNQQPGPKGLEVHLAPVRRLTRQPSK